MAQTPILLAFEPWLKPINYWTLSHGSNPQKIGLWAMAQTHQLLNFEPWLKPPKNGPLSDGSNPHLTCRFSHAFYSSFLEVVPMYRFVIPKGLCVKFWEIEAVRSDILLRCEAWKSDAPLPCPNLIVQYGHSIWYVIVKVFIVLKLFCSVSELVIGDWQR